ncbi:MAG: LemA family protein [Bacteroidetes bacterium]|nr:LemA family protein [Bacteroidota bacterium]
MTQYSEDVKSQWAQVENVYQRRADLIPNLVSTVQQYAEFEKSTLTAVIEARSRVSQIKIDASNITPEQLQKFQEAQGQLTSALSRLLVVSEQYPNLKANEQFMDLQKQLEGSENRITVERQKFNDIAKIYNVYIKSFPRNLLAGMYNFTERPYFQAEAGADKAPDVDKLFKR